MWDRVYWEDVARWGSIIFMYHILHGAHVWPKATNQESKKNRTIRQPYESHIGIEEWYVAMHDIPPPVLCFFSYSAGLELGIAALQGLPNGCNTAAGHLLLTTIYKGGLVLQLSLRPIGLPAGMPSPGQGLQTHF